jgi:hypothetical protein
MTLIKPQHTGETRQPPCPGVPAGAAATATLLPFPGAGRRTRRAPRDGEQRGEILQFLGVRYERLAS